MVNHSKALYLIQKALDRRRNALANLQAKPDAKPREVQLAEALIESYEASALALRRDEAGPQSEGPAYEAARYSPDPVDNAQRAGWALEALRHYARQNRWGGEEVIEDGDQEHIDEVAGDLMNDLYHLLADVGLDPQVLHDRAVMGYEEERAEEAQDEECARCGDPVDNEGDEVCEKCAAQIDDGADSSDFPWVTDGSRAGHVVLEAHERPTFEQTLSHIKQAGETVGLIKTAYREEFGTKP